MSLAVVVVVVVVFVVVVVICGVSVLFFVVFRGGLFVCVPTSVRTCIVQVEVTFDVNNASFGQLTFILCRCASTIVASLSLPSALPLPPGAPF